MPRHTPDPGITRRRFLQGAAALAAAAGARRMAGAPVPAAYPAIDAHVHFVDTNRPQGVPWPPRSDTSIYRPHLPDTFAVMTAPFRVLGEVVIEASPWLEDNQWVLDLARDHEGIVGYIGHLDPGSPGFAAHLRRFSANPIFRGIRLEGAGLKRLMGQKAFLEDMRRLGGQRLALDVVSGDPALDEMKRLAEAVPDLRLVIDHLPFRDWDGRPEAMRSALAGLAACPNVYAKVSAVVRLKGGRNIQDPAFYRPTLDVLRELFGPRRIVYASNWPASARTATYGEIYAAVAPYFSGRSRSEAENFFWRNSIDAYDWVPRGAAAALRKSA